MKIRDVPLRMATENEQGTTVNSRGGVPIPAIIRDQFDIQPGDNIRWPCLGATQQPVLFADDATNQPLS